MAIYYGETRPYPFNKTKWKTDKKKLRKRQKARLKDSIAPSLAQWKESAIDYEWREPSP